MPGQLNGVNDRCHLQVCKAFILKSCLSSVLYYSWIDAAECLESSTVVGHKVGAGPECKTLHRWCDCSDTINKYNMAPH